MPYIGICYSFIIAFLAVFSWVSVNRKSRRIDLHLKHLSVGHTKKASIGFRRQLGRGMGRLCRRSGLDVDFLFCGFYGFALIFCHHLDFCSGFCFSSVSSVDSIG